MISMEILRWRVVTEGWVLRRVVRASSSGRRKDSWVCTKRMRKSTFDMSACGGKVWVESILLALLSSGINQLCEE